MRPQSISTVVLIALATTGCRTTSDSASGHVKDIQFETCSCSASLNCSGSKAKVTSEHGFPTLDACKENLVSQANAANCTMDDSSFETTSPNCTPNGAAANSAPSSDRFKCVSWNNTGRDPWYLVFTDYSGQSKDMSYFVFANEDDCNKAVNGARPLVSTIRICVSQLQNGKGPWDLGSVDRQGTAREQNRTIYMSLSACNAALNASKVVGDTMMICASQNFNGAKPWEKFRMTEDALREFDPYHLFDSFDACLSGD